MKHYGRYAPLAPREKLGCVAIVVACLLVDATIAYLVIGWIR
jgi:hypothetical protein